MEDRPAEFGKETDTNSEYARNDKTLEEQQELHSGEHPIDLSSQQPDFILKIMPIIADIVHS